MKPTRAPRIDELLDRARSLAHDLEQLAALPPDGPSPVRLALTFAMNAVSQLENAQSEAFRATLPSPAVAR